VPVVVLVDEWSASASELLTGALQDHQRASVVGVLTFGKGSVQSIIELPGGAGLKLTTARYYTPSGHAVQADGIHPDVVVEKSTKHDPNEVSQREKDQPNHLPAEGPQGGAPAHTVTAVTIDAGGASSSTDGGLLPSSVGILATDVPADPETSDDSVLRIGFQVLRTKMAEHGVATP
jgi:carboxyl-terminal processing protease